MADLLQKYRGSVVIMVVRGGAEMINNEQTGSLNASVLLLWLAASAIAPLRVSGGGVCYALRGGNHMMHFRQSNWKKLVRGAIK